MVCHIDERFSCGIEGHGRFSWALQVGHCKRTTAQNHPVPVLHTSLFSSKGPVSWFYFVLVDSGGLDLIHPCETVQTSCARVISRLNCFCHHLDVKISGSIMDWRNASSEMDDLHSFLSIWLGVHRGSSWTSPFGAALVLTLVSSWVDRKGRSLCFFGMVMRGHFFCWEKWQQNQSIHPPVSALWR